MGLFRIEVSVAGGERLKFEQVAYRNGQGDILVLDEEVKAPEGFTRFDPDADPPQPDV